MANNTAGMCASWKQQIMAELNGDVLKAALYTVGAGITALTSAYSPAGEVVSAGYTAGGTGVSNGTVGVTGTTAYWTPTANWSWTGITANTDCVLLYNTSKTNRAIASLTYGAQGIVAGNFGLAMPVNDANTGLIRLQ